MKAMILLEEFLNTRKNSTKNWCGITENLEIKEPNIKLSYRKKSSKDAIQSKKNGQMSMEQYFSNNLLDEIKTLDINNITPVQALTILNNLKNKLG